MVAIADVALYDYTLCAPLPGTGSYSYRGVSAGTSGPTVAAPADSPVDIPVGALILYGAFFAALLALVLVPA